MHFDVLIVGAGHGGAQAAAMLRQLKFEGSIALLGEEPELPYERPPLSKEYFAGEKDFERILLRPAQFWEERGTVLRLGEKADEVDPVNKIVTTDHGHQISYGKLIWATGGAPRRLSCPGGDFPNVFGIRTKADADSLKAAAMTANNVVIVGGGYIGLEAAAVLTKLGKKVTVLEALNRVLARVAGEEISNFYEKEHRERGVAIRFNTRVEEIVGEDKATGVRLADGEIIPADLVIVGIGIAPAVGPLIDAGAEGGNGVLVDEFCRTSLDAIYAIGDCAAYTSQYAGDVLVRLESVQNANDQARTVAKHICGGSEPYRAVPWFWSNQYDLRLQTVGLSIGYDQTVTRGDPHTRSFSVVYLRAGAVIALDCVNAPRDYAQGKLLVMKSSMPDPSRLSDAQVELKDLA